MKNDMTNIISHETIVSRPMTEAENEESKLISKKAFFKDKYRNALKTVTKLDIQELAKEHPDWCTKDVLVYIIKNYNPDLPSQILIEMTQFITSEWDIVKSKQLALA